MHRHVARAVYETRGTNPPRVCGYRCDCGMVMGFSGKPLAPLLIGDRGVRPSKRYRKIRTLGRRQARLRKWGLR